MECCSSREAGTGLHSLLAEVIMNSHLRLFDNLWEGVFATDFTLEHVRQRCSQLVKSLLAHRANCLVAYDTRFMSNLFAHDIYYFLKQRGVEVKLVPTPVPLPAVQLALNNNQAHCALYVSARNRPYWYNGIVLLEQGVPHLSLEPDPDNGSVAEGTEPQPFPASADSNAAAQSFIADSTLDARKPYIDMLRNLIDINLIRRVTLTIFADPMHGTLAGYLPAVIGDGSYTKAIEINREVDPLFGKVTPLPSQAALSRLCKLVRESDSHIGLAFSADGTALGVVDKNGEQLEQLEIVLLLASYLSSQYRQKGVVIAPPPAAGTPLATATAELSSWEDTLGFKVELVSNPDERITEFLKQQQHNLLVGCTSAGELILSKYSSYPDALVAGLLMIELAARGGGSLRTSLDNLRALLSIHK